MVIKTRELQTDDFQSISDAFSGIGWNKPLSLFEKYYNEQLSGERFCFVAFCDDQFAGYITLIKKSKYEHFGSENIPEISDLNVLPIYRNQGIGTTLIQECEKQAKTFSHKIGLGVGLISDYTNAMRLYLKLGYKFDGKGIAYNGEILQYGKQTIVDDDLNLYLLKSF
jgi:GNAT superfamily N-acetyltransferase